MTTPRRRVLRPTREAPPFDPQRERQIVRRRVRLEQERAGFDRWMARLRRAGNEVAKRQKTIARLERELARLHGN